MDSQNGLSMRVVKLKVLYTFDTEHKNNHLARGTETLHVQTAFLDEITQIGIIDLKQCLDVVTSASPELTSEFINDYTVYAYDYSEPDTPLVGHGLLSRIHGDTDVDNQDVVTGRIMRNAIGLFSRNAQETLEVKLRLTPVSVPQRHRSGSVSSQDGGQQWLGSQNNASFGSHARPSSPIDPSGHPAMQKLTTEGEVLRNRDDAFTAEGQYGGSGSRPPSRSATPALAQPFHPPPSKPNTSSNARPSSRAGTRQSFHARRESFNSGYFSGEDNVDEGPTRKRAKTTKVDWPTKTELNIERQPDSLRVAASTASSVRIHRPVPVNLTAALQTGTLIEEPVRPPTPIPNTKTGKPRGRPRKVIPHNLIRAARARHSSPAPPEISGQHSMPEGSMSSPEDIRGRSVSSTPANIPSSPPVMPNQGPMATSPTLPPMLLDNQDSGFMSGNLDDLFGEDVNFKLDDYINDKMEFNDDVTTFHQNNSNVPNQFTPVFDKGTPIEKPAPIAQPLPPPSLPFSQPMPAPAKQMPRAQSFSTAPRHAMSSPKLAPAPVPRARQIMDEQRAQIATLPPAPASKPAAKILQRSQTWAPDMSDALTSDAPGPSETTSKNAPRKRAGKDQTKARLESAIASGEMPPFCDNCGAIETPAWRRAFTRIFNCPWNEVDTSLEQGACCYKEPLEYNADGSIKRIRGFKTERRSDDKPEEWIQICLCNRKYTCNNFRLKGC